jgi:hypothetical protein
MTHSTAKAASPAILLSAEQIAALAPLFGDIARLADFIIAFKQQSPSPSSINAAEEELLLLTRLLGRDTLEALLNSIEPSQPADKKDLPGDINVGGIRHRCRGKTPHQVSTSFGSIILHRFLFEPRQGDGPCLFPLEDLLGLVGGKATPAFASRVGQLIAQHTQRQLLDILAVDYGVIWGVSTLRKVGACLAGIMSGQRQAAQTRQVIDWLRQAWRGRGRYDVVLAVGRDGIMLPIRGGDYKEGAIATLAVYDRWSKRVGTVYLGWMPQENQEELSRQLTALVQAVLIGWKGRRPRVAYITDGGAVQATYYKDVLRWMTDPVTGQRLEWERVVDYYHAAQYVTKMAEALFGKTTRAWRWAQRMRRMLKEANGLRRVLQSASYYRNEERLLGSRSKRAKEFFDAYNYMSKRGRFMRYAEYRSKGVPIGSGVTEAGCKVVVTQRMKLSGMDWGMKGGQVVLNLRVAWLSGLWRSAWKSHLLQSDAAVHDSYAPFRHQLAHAAA